VLDLVSYAWAGFGAAFGPVVLLSLFWKRMTRNGALSGIVVGGVTVLLWKHVPALSGTGLYELVPGFVLGLLAITIVSLIDKAPSRAIQDEYDKATRPLPRETA
jgi:sodium/proline symporter